MSAASRPQAMRTRPSTGARFVGSTSHQPSDSQTSKMAWKSGGFSWCAKALTARAGMPDARHRVMPMCVKSRHTPARSMKVRAAVVSLSDTPGS